MEKQQIISSTPLVSILMLTFNREQFIGEAIESILVQSYQAWELLVIDDGSTDETYKLMAAYTDPRIRYIRHSENKGLRVRRRESLTYAGGQYVAVLDSDDVWVDSEKLALQVAHLQAHPECVLVGSFLTLIDAKSNQFDSNRYHATDKDIRSAILTRNQFAHSSVLMRRSALEKTSGYPDLAVAEDLDLFLQLGLLGEMANLPEYLTAYRRHGVSASSQRKEVVGHVILVTKKYRHKYPNYFRAYLKHHLRYLLLSLGQWLKIG